MSRAQLSQLAARRTATKKSRFLRSTCFVVPIKTDHHHFACWHESFDDTVRLDKISWPARHSNNLSRKWLPYRSQCWYKSPFDRHSNTKPRIGTDISICHTDCAFVSIQWLNLRTIPRPDWTPPVVLPYDPVYFDRLDSMYDLQCNQQYTVRHHEWIRNVVAVPRIIRTHKSIVRTDRDIPGGGVIRDNLHCCYCGRLRYSNYGSDSCCCCCYCCSFTWSVDFKMNAVVLRW